MLDEKRFFVLVSAQEVKLEKRKNDGAIVACVREAHQGQRSDRLGSVHPVELRARTCREGEPCQHVRSPMYRWLHPNHRARRDRAEDSRNPESTESELPLARRRSSSTPNSNASRRELRPSWNTPGRAVIFMLYS